MYQGAVAESYEPVPSPEGLVHHAQGPVQCRLGLHWALRPPQAPRHGLQSPAPSYDSASATYRTGTEFQFKTPQS